MKIKSIKLEGFKRFTDLKIEGIPETAKLVVMIGPNGCGKSSVFDALHAYRFSYLSENGEMDFEGSHHYRDNLDYFKKSGLSMRKGKSVEIKYHTEPENMELWEKSVRIRTSYRNDPICSTSFSTSLGPVEEDRQFLKLTENDESVSMNLWRLASQWLEQTSGSEPPTKGLETLQMEVFGELYSAMNRLFSEQNLKLNNLGNPANGIFFQFDKGISKRFSFNNLASGEKAALDLLLDLIVSKTELIDTVFCIDEPEAHIHTKLQGLLLEELYNLIPDNSQLWIATHSIGMVRKAQDLWRDNPDSVVFLDFGNRNFDEEVTITPAEPNPSFWSQTYDVVLGDLAELVITGRTVFCEGEGFDEDCYKNIFKNQYPEIHFTSLGGRENVVKSVTAANLAIGKIAKSAKVIGIVDRDKATDGEIERDSEKGIRTLSRKSIENYLLDDEVLTKLCEKHGKQDKIQDLLTAKTDALNNRTSGGKSKSPDDLKPIAQDIHVAAQGIIDSVPLGNNKESFMKDILAKLIQPGMAVYEKLHKDIFGE